MRGRRRIRSQGTWLPTLGNEIEGSNPPQALNGRSLSLGLAAPGVGFSTGVISLTTDRPRQDPTEADSLADVIGSEWFLKRIVGSCFVTRLGVLATEGDDQVDAGAPALVGCGFFVARADTVDPDVPIGFATNAEDAYNPLNERNIREPWIWRRTWILGNFGTARLDPSQANGTQSSDFAWGQNAPPSNMFYGSVADGPKIDAKTKRRITNDDRLFFAASLTRAGFEQNENTSVFAEVYLDYRLFGQSRKPRNNGNF